MHQHRMISLAAALLLGTAGAAYAAGGGVTGNPGNPGNQATPQAGGAVANPPGAHSGHGHAVRNMIGEWAVGYPVYTRNGELLGTVREVQGERVTIALGQHLGIGGRDMVLSTQQLNQSGSGADMRLISNLSDQELRQQPTVER